MIKRLLVVSLLLAGVSACTDQRSHSQAVYMLVDTSGTYAQEVRKAQLIINYLLGTLQSGDSLVVARVRSRSFNEKDIIARCLSMINEALAAPSKAAFDAKWKALLDPCKAADAVLGLQFSAAGCHLSKERHRR